MSFPKQVNARNILFTALGLLLLSGCAAKRDKYDVPALNLPAQFAKAPAVVDAANSKNISGNSPASSVTTALSSPLNAALAEWWRLLGSQELNGLMDRALANNPDLRIATLRIAQSNARLSQAGADRFPTLSMPIQSNTTFPEFGAGRGNANGINTARPTNQISLKADWRPDIWGETASLYDSAELQILRATYQRDDMQRTVTANVAVTYLEYLSLNDRLRVARETEKSLSEMLESVDARMEIGDATVIEMEQQKAAVYSVKATIPVLEQQRDVVRNRLAALLGSAPVTLMLSDKGLDSAKFPSILPGVPSALLLRRPDVRAVEARLLAADADIDVARTRILPPLDLTAQAGYGSMYMAQVFSPQSLFWNTIGSLTVSIFDSGKRSKEVEYAQAMHEELLETYVRVIYDAVREVDDSLSGINSMSRRVEAQSIAADSSLRAWNYSQEVFMAGVVDYIVLLDTQRTYQLNMDNWYNVRMDSYRNLVNLFSALGGGVASGDVMPGNGARPAQLASEIEYGAVLAETDDTTKSDTASPVQGGNAPNINAGLSLKEPLNVMLAPSRQNRVKAKGVDWTGSVWRGNSKQWLVELSGVYDRGAVLPAWRDLRARYPQQMENRTLLPQRQGHVKVAGKERASWYRLFIATFSGKKMAEDYCAMLAAEQQRCGVVSSKSLAGKGDFVEPSTAEQYEIAAAVAEAPIKIANTKHDESPLNAHVDSPQVKDAQPIPTQVEAPASTPAILATETEAVPVSSPKTMIERWLKDWAEKNAEAYLSHYDIGFRPDDGKNRAAWEAERRHRLGEAASIKVRATKLKLEQQSERMVTARFEETLKVGRYKKISRKKLLLIRGVRDGEWKIWEERKETAADMQAAAKATAARVKNKHAEKSDAQPAPVPQDGKQFDGIDWSGESFWFVEMSDVHDRSTLTLAWRNLLAQFPEQMKNRTIVPRSRGGMNDASDAAATRYQLFIAKFSEKQMAEEFCSMLSAGQQHCSVVSSQSFAEKDGLNPSPATGSKGGLL